MARGPSGRVVIELDPELKRELHGSLVSDGTNLKEWFIAQARAYLRSRRAPELPGLADLNQDFYGQAAEEPGAYKAAPAKDEPPQAESKTD